MAQILIVTCILTAILHFFFVTTQWEETQTACCLIRKFLRNTRSLFMSVSVLLCDFSFLVKILNFEICSVFCLPVEKKAELASSVSFYSQWSSPFPRCVLLPFGQPPFLLSPLHFWLHSGLLGGCFVPWSWWSTAIKKPPWDGNAMASVY